MQRKKQKMYLRFDDLIGIIAFLTNTNYNVAQLQLEPVSWHVIKWVDSFRDAWMQNCSSHFQKSLPAQWEGTSFSPCSDRHL